MENGPERPRLMGDNIPDEVMREDLQRFEAEQVNSRIWKRDYTLWSSSPEEISNRLGWLTSHRLSGKALREINELSEEVRGEGYTHALLMGMGGSSMAPEVFRRIFGVQEGYLDLHIIDSTDPEAVREKEDKLDPARTLYIVSTKSGGTVETVSLMKYFYNRAAADLGNENAGRHFIAITDPGSSLEKTAAELGFRKTFLNDPDIGGRYSALSYFGLVPAALIGVDLNRLLHNAGAMAGHSEMAFHPAEDGNTPAWLGMALGALGKKGRDKVTLISSSPLAPFGAWLEQLLAESTGKKGTGLLPVDGESIAEPDVYAADRLFIYFRLQGDTAFDDDTGRIKSAGHPVIQVDLRDRYDLAGEFFRWMMATAVAGWSLGINPFDQPNVEAAKIRAREMTEAYREKGALPSFTPDLEVDGIEVYSGQKTESLPEAWNNFLEQAQPGEEEGKGRSYIAIQAYLKPDPETDRALQALQNSLRNIYRMAVTVGYGPRYLHSTGQLHKGDGGNGLFVQLTADQQDDLPVPDRAGSEASSITFGVLKAAQATGDRQALLDAGRKVIRFHLDRDTGESIGVLIAALEK